MANPFEEIQCAVGPIGVDWTYEEMDCVRARGGRTRAQVTVKVARKRITGKGRSKQMVEFTIWGTAPKGAKNPRELAKLEAIKNGLMWLGLLPDRALAFGLELVLDRLGPVGLDWGFEEVLTRLKPDGKVRCEAEISVKKSLVSESGKGRGEITHEEWGEARSDEDCPEDRALVRAVKNAMQFLCVAEDDPDVQDYDEIVEEQEAVSTPPKKALGKLMPFNKAAALASCLGGIVILAMLF